MRKLHADSLPELVRMALRRRSAPRATATGKTSWGRPGNLAALYGARTRNWGLYFENQFDLRRGLSFVVGGRGDVAYRRYEDHFLRSSDVSHCVHVCALHVSGRVRL